MITEKSEKQKTIRVVIADDHPIITASIKLLLDREADIEVVGEARDGREALDRIQELHPDVLLLDLKMPAMDGFSVLKALQQYSGGIKVLILTSSEDKREYVEAMKLGCSGIILKQTALSLIVKSIRKVNAGEIWLDSHTMSTVLARFSEKAGDLPAERNGGRERAVLSNRERAVAKLVSQGYRNKDMAGQLCISEQTVKNHLHNIFDKLGISDRLELALYAIHNGIHLEAGERAAGIGGRH